MFLDYTDAGYAQSVLWCGGIAPAFREPMISEPFFPDDEQGAIEQTRAMLKQYRKAQKSAS